jgi:ABC-type sugar transport system substrate-binding protein
MKNEILSDQLREKRPQRIPDTKRLRTVFIFLFALLWILPVFAQHPPKVTFLAPNPEGAQMFWTQSIGIMKAVADDLQIDLKIIYSRPGSYHQKKDGLEVLESRPLPDYFLTIYLLEATRHHLKLAEQSGVLSFVFNAGVVPEDREEVGRPREKYRLWIGQMIPDDRQAGYLLADKLIDQAKIAGKTGSDGKVHLISLGGLGASIDKFRENGLTERINERKDSVLDRTILTGWSQSVAYDETIKALEKFPTAGVIWCVSDTTALAAVEAAKKLGKTPGKDLFIGGIDWNQAGIQAVASGDMAVTVGGHFLEGAKALILIHDYHHGIDFVDKPGVEMQTRMKAITTDNAEEYLQTLSKLDWSKIDFRKFSKKYNPGLENYDLSLDVLLGLKTEQ